jgi:hypothetical protein
LDHVLLNATSFLQHVLGEIQGGSVGGDVDESQNEALMVDIIGNLSIILALQTVQDLRDVKG